MSWRNLIHMVLVVLSLTMALPWAVDRSSAEPVTEAKSRQILQSQEFRKSAYERRKEAKTRLQEAIEKRKNQRVALSETILSRKGKKGVQNE